MDGIALEVVAKTEVAEHLEEGVVTRGVTDIFEIIVLATGSHAALRGHGTGITTLLGPQKHILELNHPRVGE